MTAGAKLAKAIPEKNQPWRVKHKNVRLSLGKPHVLPLAVLPHHLPQKHPRITPRHLCHLLRRPLRDHQPAGVAAFWAEVYHPVGGADHVQVVLDDDHSRLLPPSIGGILKVTHYPGGQPDVGRCRQSA
ncbi:MAG: hypothetical protein JXA33_14610 [Anaerolineae bacterium]|nr:hypothetical protein [Anaerolineae bacterium]